MGILNTSYLNFTLDAQPKHLKTQRWILSNAVNGTVLGGISWHTGFRKYSFFPLNNLVFDSGCLDEISTFLKQQNQLYKGRKV